MQADIGHRIEPVPRGGIEGAEVGDLQPREEVLFHVPDAIFHAAFFIALADIAWGKGTAVVPSKVGTMCLST